MDLEQVRRYCLSLPHATEQMQWGDALVFKIGGKMFAVVSTEPEPGAPYLSFKSSPEEFAELTERPGIVPAPYLARAHWVALEAEDAMPAAELKQRLRQARELVLAKLPKKKQADLR